MPLEPEVATPVERLVTGLFYLCIGLALLPLARRLLARILGTLAAPPPAPWRASDLGVVFASVIFAVIFLGLAAAGEGEPSIFVQLGASIATLVVGVAVAMLLAVRASASLGAAFLLRVGGLARALGGSIVVYLLCIPGVLGAGVAWPAMLELLGFTAEEQPVVSAMRTLDPAERPTALLLGVVLAPLAEELFFRGFLQRALGRWLSPASANALAALVFAALHGWFAFLPIFILSLLLGCIAHATRNVLAAFAVHAVFNAQTFVFLWVFPEVGRALEGAPLGLWALVRGG